MQCFFRLTSRPSGERRRSDAYVLEGLKIPNFSITWEPESAFVSSSGDLGYLLETNMVSFTGEDGQLVTIPGKVVTIWRKNAEGEWKCVVDMWNAAPAEGKSPER